MPTAVDPLARLEAVDASPARADAGCPTRPVDPLARLEAVDAALMEPIEALEAHFSNLVKLLTDSSLKASEG